MIRITGIIVGLFVVQALHASIYAHHKKAIVIGASSGMGREVAKLLAREGYILGLVARRIELLQSLQEEIKTQSSILSLDVTEPLAQTKLREFIDSLGGLDLIVISISAYLDNRNAAAQHDNEFHPPYSWKEKERYIDVDAKGFIAMADVALDYFKKQNSGHLVGISSTSGLRGRAYNPEYCAAKACISCYMEGQRNFMQQNNLHIDITDIVPGFVAVEHSPAGEEPSAYWEISVHDAARYIMSGIKQKKKVVYVPPKIQFIALLLKTLPDTILNSFFSWM